MVVVAEPLAGLAGSNPAVFDSREPALVESDSADGVVAGTEEQIVAANQPGEDRDRHDQPPATDDGPPRENHENDGEGKRGEACVCEALVGFCQRVAECGAPGYARAVFVGGVV